MTAKRKAVSSEAIPAKKAKPKKQKTSSAKGDAAKAHAYLMQSQSVTTEGLPPRIEKQGNWEALSGNATPEQVKAFLEGADAADILEPTDEELEIAAKEAIRGGRFVTGGKPGPGRPKGSRNKLAEAFIQDFYNDWTQYGAGILEIVRNEKPDQYLKVAAAILPKQMDVRVSEFAELTEDTLDQRVAELSRELGAAMAILQPKGAVQ